MQIHVGYELKFSSSAPLAMLLMLYTHPSREESVSGERIVHQPATDLFEFLDSFGNRCARIHAPAGLLTISNDFLVNDNGEPDEVNLEARQLAVEELPADVLPFLFASRYCEVDRLSNAAWELFHHSPPGWLMVQSICDWVHASVEFGYQYARNTKSAWDVFEERKGVCRDFTHLAITFCRTMNIPARYCTGYLGDIGVPASAAPMDFSAWFEVYLENRWYTFDARHNQRRIGRILMARGRDAVDVALTTQFGHADLVRFKVWTDEVRLENAKEREPFTTALVG